MSEQKNDNKQKGDLGESLAIKHMTEQGYKIVGTKMKFPRYEIDLIAENDKELVFVEVKLRYGNKYGAPWLAVNRAKQKKITFGANAYIRQYSCEKEPRFDVISIVIENGKPELTHIENAFYPFC